MDILCIHSNAQLRGVIANYLREMEFEFECYEYTSMAESINIVKNSKPYVVLMEFTKENISSYKDISNLAFIIPLIKSIDRDIAINFEEWNVDYIFTDAVSQFRGSLMKILRKNKEQMKELLSKDKIFKNIIYGYNFTWGNTYIASIEQREDIFSLIPELSEGLEIFVVLRENPIFLEENKNVKVIWVTDIVGKNRIKPHNLTIITDNIIKFLERGDKKVVVLDCIEYLLLYNDFINIMRNLELINSYAMEHNSLVIIIVDNEAYTTKEYSLLKRYSILWKGV